MLIKSIILLFLVTTLVSCENVFKELLGSSSNVDSSFSRTNQDSTNQDNSSYTVECPTDYVLVSGNNYLGTQDFCVMKFEAKNDGGSNAVSTASGVPWVSIDANTAYTKCDSIIESGFDGQFSLISNAEWMTIARDIEGNSSNWSTGTIGSGMIPRGHSDNSPASALSISDSNDPYDGTGNTSGDSVGGGWEQKRVHYLSNGSEIWDFAGNINEWVDWDDSDSSFTLAHLDVTGGSWNEFTVNPDGSLQDYEFRPNNPSFTSAEGMGNWYGTNSYSGGAALRGGLYPNTTRVGIYTLSLYYPDAFSHAQIGFRCVYRP